LTQAIDFVALAAGIADFRAFRQQLVLQLVVLHERVEVLAHDLGALNQAELRVLGAVGPDLEDQAVVVRQLADAGVLGLEAHARDRAEVGVKPDQSKLAAGLAELLGGLVAAAALDSHFHFEGLLRGEVTQHKLRVHDFSVGVLLEVGSRHFALFADLEAQHLGHVGVERHLQLLDRQHDVRNVLKDALGALELVADALNTQAYRRGALKTAEQNAPQADADGRAKAALERRHDEAAVAVGLCFLVANKAVRQFQPTPADSHALSP